MNSKLNSTVLGILSMMLCACAQQVQYGHEPLVLDRFNFNVDIERFFSDENIFRGTHDHFMVSSEEHRLDGDSLMTGFIQYSTMRMSSDRPLAVYAGVPFESLGLITDWDDEKVLMACGETAYASGADVQRILEKLIKDYGEQPALNNEGFMSDNTLNITYKDGNKLVKLAINLSDISFLDHVEPTTLTPEIKQAINDQLNDLEAVSCHLFFTTPEMDAVMKTRMGRSGFLVHYN